MKIVELVCAGAILCAPGVAGAQQLSEAPLAPAAPSTTALPTPPASPPPPAVPCSPGWVCKSGGRVVRVVRPPRSTPQAAPDDAGADNVPPQLPDPQAGANPPAPRRIFGFGMGIGGGVQVGGAVVAFASDPELSGAKPAVNFPSLEFRYFLLENLAFHASIPIVDIAVMSATNGGVYLRSDVFLDGYVGTGSVRLVVGAGLGFEVLTGSQSEDFSPANAFRLPGEIGFEALSSGRRFGFSLLARPVLQFVSPGGVGGGGIVVLEFMGYYVK